MSSFISNSYREKKERSKNCKKQVYSPYTAQSYVFEILKNHLLTNSMTDLGFASSKVYNEDYTKSDLTLDMGHSIKLNTPDKLPGIWVIRGDARANPFTTIGGTIGKNTVDGTVDNATRMQMSVTIAVAEIGCPAVEQLAEYVAYPFQHFHNNITNEYDFIKCAVTSIGSPEAIDHAQKEAFMVQIGLTLDYFQTWRVRGDYLRLKKVEIDVAPID